MKNYSFSLEEIRRKVRVETDFEKMGIDDYKTVYCTMNDGDYLGMTFLQSNHSLVFLPFYSMKKDTGVKFDSGAISHIHKDLYYEIDNFIYSYQKNIQTLLDIKNHSKKWEANYSIAEAVRTISENDIYCEPDLMDHDLNPCPFYFPYREYKGFLFIACKDGNMFIPFSYSSIDDCYEHFDISNVITDQEKVLDWMEHMLQSYQSNLSFLTAISKKFKIYNLF